MPGIPSLNAAVVNAAPVKPVSQRPETIIARAVIVHIIIVSANTSNTPQRP